jgi:hypothetical protein
LEVEEDAFADEGCRRGVASDVDILVVKLARGACNTRAIEFIHEVNVSTGEVGVTRE